MGKLGSGVLTKDHTFMVLHQKTSLCPLQEFLKVWYVIGYLIFNINELCVMTLKEVFKILIR